MPENSAPLLRPAITLGDPAGVGPEIVLALFQRHGDEWARRGLAPFVVGSAAVLEQVARGLELSLKIETHSTPPEETPPGVVPVLEPAGFDLGGPVHPGRISARCGMAAWRYVREAVALVQEQKADAVVTAPLHKEALRAAGCGHPGHTELLADLAGRGHVAMLLVGGGLRVALATIHEAVHEVPALLSREGILRHLRLLHQFIPWFGLTARGGEILPKIGVTGLNPHAGEGGLFGREEQDIILPAIEDARREGIHAIGPLPADTVFHFQREGAYDAVLAMFHDQALIPVKTLAFHDGVNVTMGLPFIRTSVDHGTAFDVAWQGTARPDSLCAALDCAALLVRNRRAALSGREPGPPA